MFLGASCDEADSLGRYAGTEQVLTRVMSVHDIMIMDDLTWLLVRNRTVAFVVVVVCCNVETSCRASLRNYGEKGTRAEHGQRWLLLMQGCLWQKQKQPQQQLNEAPTGQTAVARNGERASRD